MEYIDENVLQYIKKTHPLYDGIIGQIQQKSIDEKVPIIKQESARFLSFFLKIFKPKKILEIGCATGFSSLLFAISTDDQTEIVTIEKNNIMIEKAKRNFEKINISKKIKLIEGDAKEVLNKMEDAFDFIFIDMAKSQYINILDDCTRLLNQKGIICADDILKNGIFQQDENYKRNKTIKKRMQSFIDKISSFDDFETNILTIGNGICFCYKK